MSLLAGIDIGGTKTAVCLGKTTGPDINLLGKVRFATPPGPQETMDSIQSALEQLILQNGSTRVQAIGISCGGPLDSQAGLVLSPPNLPGWERIDVRSPLEHHFGAPVGLQNDANACALAEWHWGAGRGCRNMIFLTFGTGMGAGLILDGRLYSGPGSLAGEVGHIRLAENGPVGYGKIGSFEGFCSGGGIARLAGQLAQELLEQGRGPLYCPTAGDLGEITAETVASAAHRGDTTALKVYEISGQYLGRGLAILVDLFNPERIVIGSIYARQKRLLEPTMQAELRKEALPQALAGCEVVPAGLGENLGDFASLSVALDRYGAVQTAADSS